MPASSMVKRFLRNNSPIFLRAWYQKLRSGRLRDKSVEDVFAEIKRENAWGSVESPSGAGSEKIQTKTLVGDLGRLLKDRGIATMLDIPSGDFNWMQDVDLSGVHYVGADIVEDLVKDNIRKHGRENVDFRTLDLVSGALPKSDLVFVRDCLVHLSYKDIFAAIENIRRSGSKYLLTTTFTSRRGNYDIRTGDWRTLNLQKAPFNFPEPLSLIVEHCTEAGGEYKDKSMALWELSALDV